MPPSVCPKGHASSDPDWCSECGAPLAANPTLASTGAAVPTSAAVPTLCPDCQTPRTPGARFCEVCRHDFTAGVPTTPAVAAVPPPPPQTASASPSLSSPAARQPDAPVAITGNAWAVVQCVKALMRPDDPTPFPETEPERAYPLDLDESLVGRRSARRDTHPEIPLTDPAASGRHLKICHRSDGSLRVIDVGSTNGTRLNDVPLDVGVERPLKPGDELTLGAWTRIRIETR